MCRFKTIECWVLVAACVAATTFVAPPAFAQRLSLAERVAKLEQQAQGGDARGTIGLVNQINALQSQVQTLQGQIEELRHQLDGMKQRGKDQYIDLDSRIGRLEGRNATAPAATAPADAGNPPMSDIQLGAPGSAAPAQNPPATNAAPEQTSARDLVATNTAAPATAGAATMTAAPANPEDAQTAYTQAFDALKDGRYAESSRLFQAFLAQYPTDALAPNAYYWLGESYYVTENYGVSLDTFRKLLANYPDSQKAPDALLKIGYCEYELKQWPQSEATLNQVVQKYPGTTVANLAQGRLRALKLEGHQ
ncbi:MAG TPA: tol-pal system protein YbgF [Rudaea sp.]|nr:tol-pal system protein YbgF [Rudaea sp.]